MLEKKNMNEESYNSWVKTNQSFNTVSYQISIDQAAVKYKGFYLLKANGLLQAKQPRSSWSVKKTEGL
jgi:hypothetical protein